MRHLALLCLVACDPADAVAPPLACDAYELAPEVPSCSVADVRGGDVLSIAGPLDNSALGDGFVRALEVYRDPATGEPGARYQRRDGTCGFARCEFEYVDLAAAIAPCGDPPLIPAVSATIANGIATMTEREWTSIVVFEDRYDAWATCVLQLTRNQ